MKITDIKTYVLKAKLTKELGFSQWYYQTKKNLLVKIITDEGIIGWGECYGPSEPIATSIEHFFKEKITGQNPLANENIWNLLWQPSLDFSRKRLLKHLDDFSLSEDLLSKDVENLSGGERQRLGFIIALLLDRDILLLDEVTSSLDIEMKKKVEEYIKKSDKTVLLISHDTHWDIKNFKVVRW